MTDSDYLPPTAEVPVWASQLNYTSGPDIGQPTKVAPSSGQIAEGFVPNTKLPAPWANWFWNTLAAHDRSNSGWFVHNWTAGAFFGGAFEPNGLVGDAAVTMMSAATDGEPLVVAIDAAGQTWRVYNETASDVSAVDATLAAGDVDTLAAGLFGGDPKLLAVLTDGTCLQSIDLGDTWTSAGSVPSSGENVAHYYAAEDRWIIATTAAARFKYSDDLITWTDGTGAGGAHTTPRAMADSGTAVVSVYYEPTGLTQCARSADGIAWTLQTLSAGGHAWRGVAYSDVRTAWMAVANDGVGAVSLDNGLAWTAIAIPVGVKDVIAFGRWFVVVYDDGAGKVSIGVSEDLGGSWHTFVLQIDNDSACSYDRLKIWDGRVVAIGTDGNFRRRIACSLRAPWMPTPW